VYWEVEDSIGAAEIVEIIGTRDICMIMIMMMIVM